MTQAQFDRIHQLMMEFRGKENARIEAHIITEIFNLHNVAMPNKPEYSKGCGGCRQRVWNRLNTYYDENKQQWGY